MHVKGGACMSKGGMRGKGDMYGKGGMCVAKEGVCMVKEGMHGRRDGHCSGRYASYWNAFLFQCGIHRDRQYASKKMLTVTFDVVHRERALSM